MATADVRIVTRLEGLAEVTRGLDSIGKSGGGLSAQLKGVGDSLKSIGTTLSVAVTAPLAAFGASILKTTADFDTQMRRVNTLLGGTTQDMQKLEKAALDLGKSTSFSASEVAAGFQVLAQAGYDANTTVELTSKIINLAGAEMISFDKAAQITTDTIAQFGLSTNDVSTVINKFVTIGAASKTNVAELGEALSKVGAVANSAGYDLDEMLAALGSMAEAGTRGSEAGVALSGAIAQLLKPTEAAAQYLKDLNVTVMDGTGQMRPFNTIIKELSDSGVTTAQMFEIFGREAGKYVVSMLNSTEATTRFQNILSGPLLDAAKMAGVQMEGLTGTWEQFGGAVETLSIMIGKAGLEQWAIDLVTAGIQVVDWVSELSPGMLKLGSAIAVAAAATGPIVLGLGAVTAAIAAIGAPVALAIAAVAALGAALWTFRDKLAPVAEAAKPVFEFIATAWSTSITKIKGLYDEVVAGFSEGVVPGVRNAVTALSNFITSTYENYATGYPALIRSAGTKIAEAMGGWFGPDVQRLIQGGVHGLATGMQAWLMAIPKAISFIRDSVTNAWRFVFGDFSGVLAGLADLRNKIKAAVAAVANQFEDSLSGGIGAAFGAAVGAIVAGGIKLAQGVGALLPKLAQGVVSLFSGIKWDQAGAIVARGITVVGDAIEDFFKGYAQAFEAATGIALRGIGSKAVDLIVRGIKAAPGAVLAALEKLWDLGPEVGAAVERLFSGLGGNIVSGLKSAIDRAKGMLGDAWTTLFGGAAPAAAEAGEAISGVAGQIDILGSAANDNLSAVRNLGAAISGAAGQAEIAGGANDDLLASTQRLSTGLGHTNNVLSTYGLTTNTAVTSTERLSTSLGITTTSVTRAAAAVSDTVAKTSELTPNLGDNARGFDQVAASADQATAAVSAVAPAAKAAADEMKLTGGAGSDTFNLIETEATTATSTIGTAFSSAFSGMRSVLSNFIATGKLDFSSLKDSVVSSFIDMGLEGVQSFVTQGLADLLGFKTGSTTAMTEATTSGKSLWSSFSNFVNSIFGQTSDTAATTGDAIVGSMGEDTLQVKNLWSSVGNFFTSVWDAAKNALGPILDGIMSAFGSLGKGIMSLFSGLGESVGGWFESLAGWASDSFGSITDGLGALWDGAKSIFSGLSDSLGDIGKGITDVVGDLGSLGKAAGDVLGTLGQIAGAAGTGAGIGSLVGKLTGGNGTGSTIGGTIGGIAGSFIPIPGGTLIGSALGGLIGGLFGSKPSDKMMSATLSYRSGSITSLGGNLKGEKYSKENQDAAKQIANTIGTMARKLQNATGGYLTDGVAVEVGSRDGVKLLFGAGQKSVRYSNTTELLNAAWAHMQTKLVGGDKSKISTIKWATGGDGIFSRRMLLEVGEAGPERVQVSKLGGSYGGGGGGITTNINIQGPMVASGLTMNQFSRDLVANIERETFRRRGRRSG